MRIEHRIRRDLSWEALEAEQRKAVQEVLESPSPLGILLASEPNPTYTYGRSVRENSLELPPDASVHPVTRGGKWTYHGPGQLLIYPLFRLMDFGYDRREVRLFVDDLRKALQSALCELGVQTEAKDEPYGLYVGEAKLASFGVAIERGVCHHGFALYLSNQRSYFRAIHPCGVPDQAITDLHQLGLPLSWEDASQQVIETLKNYFCQSSQRLII